MYMCAAGGTKAIFEENVQLNEQQPLSKSEASAITNTPAEEQVLPTGGHSLPAPTPDEPPAGDKPPAPKVPPAPVEQSSPEEPSSTAEDVAGKSAKEEWWDAQKAEESSRRRAEEAPVSALECGGGADYIAEAGAQAQARTSPRKPGGEGSAINPRNSDCLPLEHGTPHPRANRLTLRSPRAPSVTTGQLKRELKGRGAEPPEDASRDALRDMLTGLLSDEHV